jgi:hypothetical protein
MLLPKNGATFSAISSVSASLQLLSRPVPCR